MYTSICMHQTLFFRYIWLKVHTSKKGDDPCFLLLQIVKVKVLKLVEYFQTEKSIYSCPTLPFPSRLGFLSEIHIPVFKPLKLTQKGKSPIFFPFTSHFLLPKKLTQTKTVFLWRLKNFTSFFFHSKICRTPSAFSKHYQLDIRLLCKLPRLVIFSYILQPDNLNAYGAIQKTLSEP